MTDAKFVKTKKNALYIPPTERAQLVDGGRIFAWKEKVPWFCTSKARLMATIRSQMQLSYSPKGNYQLAYIQDLDPQLQRMRWTYRMIAHDANGEKLFDFLVDTRELTVYPETKSWVYQIHFGDEVGIRREFERIASWDRDLMGHGWFQGAQLPE